MCRQKKEDVARQESNMHIEKGCRKWSVVKSKQIDSRGEKHLPMYLLPIAFSLNIGKSY